MKKLCCCFISLLLIVSFFYVKQMEIEPMLTSPTMDEPIAVPKISENSSLKVHYINVGQADAALVMCDNQSMLIDGGNAADSNLIAAYLKKENISTLDYVVCTHAHEDHVGGLSGALSVVSVNNVIAPKTEADTKAYKNFKRKALEQGVTIQHPAAGDSFMLGSSNIQIIGPITEHSNNLNNTSIVMKLTYGNTSFLFTGDAEREEEQEIINAGYDLSADVLKVGHHGSDTSTSYVWLREIMPEYAVISVGKGNSYGHPTETVLSRLRDANVKLYRTDLQGDTLFASDGGTVTVTTEKNEIIQTNETVKADTETAYIGNKNSKKFHRPDCHTLPAEKNRVPLVSYEDAVNNGYSPCGNCLRK
ncbi:MAG: MBL fold metallo-hydrolase [Clostridia bacterium]|nr:MBL fold metallo-hydrolase [Clostridia bacterium]